MEPVNAAATLIFALAIVHAFGAARFMAMAHHVQEAHVRAQSREGSGGGRASGRNSCTS